MTISNAIKFTNARVFVDGSLKTAYDVFVYNGKIVSEFPVNVSDRLTVVDCNNNILAPGFIDIQNNGAYGIDFSCADDINDAIDSVASQLVATGCTSFCPTIITSSTDSYRRILQSYNLDDRANGNQSRTHCLGLHLEGPMISYNKSGCHPKNFIEYDKYKASNSDDARRLIEYVYGSNLNAAVIVTLDPSYEGSQYIVKELVSHGIIVNVGHTVATYEQAMTAINAGASGITHLFNAMNGLTVDNPGVVGVLSDAKNFSINRKLKLANSWQTSTLYYGVIADLLHISHESLFVPYKLHPDGMCLITDCMAALGLGDGIYAIGESRVIVGGKDIRQAVLADTNTLAGAITPLNVCINNFVKTVNSPITYALKAATETPAAYVGIDSYKGKIQPGYDADLVLIDDNINVKETYIMGNKVYSQTSIN